jgi:hypothetical protein
MNTIAARRFATPQPQLSTALRVVTAVAVAGFMAVAWAGAEQASHQAVQSAAQAISAAPTTHVTLPAVEVVGRREPAAVKRT